MPRYGPPSKPASCTANRMTNSSSDTVASAAPIRLNVLRVTTEMKFLTIVDPEFRLDRVESFGG